MVSALTPEDIKKFFGEIINDAEEIKSALNCLESGVPLNSQDLKKALPSILVSGSQFSYVCESMRFMVIGVS